MIFDVYGEAFPFSSPQVDVADESELVKAIDKNIPLPVISGGGWKILPDKITAFRPA